MKKYVILIFFNLLLSCNSDDGSSNSYDDINIDGTWVECNVITDTEIFYQELVINYREVKNTLYRAADDQCISTDLSVITTDVATLVLDNPHLSSTGLQVYDYTLINISRQSDNTTELIPNYYTIVFIDSNKFYSGLNTSEKDGTSEEKRHTEISFDGYLTRQ